MKLQDGGQARDIGGQIQCTPDAFGGDPGDTGELLGADRRRQIVVGPRAGKYRDTEGEIEQMHLQADLVGDANQRGVRVRAEFEIAQQRSGIVGAAVVVSVDRRQRPAGGVGPRDDLERRIVRLAVPALGTLAVLEWAPGEALRAGTPMSYVAVEGGVAAAKRTKRYNVRLAGRMMF